MTIRGAATTAAAALSALVLLTGCGDDSGGSTEPKVVEVTVEDGEVTPAGDRIAVDVDQPVDIVITSDVAGEIHVHSTPETSAEFAVGDNAPVELQFDRPGVVEVELHEPFEGPVVELEVS